ncbi:hypothetical protein PIGHUM_01041 [Pigmentiphaga humi]|uniref:TM2 domain protein n=1 Tax=Pigmentiphaga humi TaxID=2478468 RepID=A0A3P4AYY8_9BURK|nr:hypothetical protein [Pigmentiphaga humi]VCU68982.1 hypothetical protein PIGHUM_01041 [Pigmentiphaga humi]
MNYQHPPAQAEEHASHNPPAAFRSKALAGFLAATLGWAGAHWRYLGRKHGWIPLLVSLLAMGTALRSEQWYFHIGFFLFLIPAAAGFIEALIICLMADEKFDALYNPGLQRRAPSGWAPVLVAMPTLAIGTSIVTLGIVLMVQRAFGVVPVY